MRNVYICVTTTTVGAALIAQLVKNLPAMQETRIQSEGLEDPLEKEMAAHSSIAWRIPWTEEPGRPQSMELQESDMTEQLTLSLQAKERCGWIWLFLEALRRESDSF